MAVVDPPRGLELGDLFAEDDVLGSREDLDQLVVLMDHAYTVLVCLARGAYVDAFAILIHLTLIRLIDSREHVHEGRLAASILPQERHDLAPADG